MLITIPLIIVLVVFLIKAHLRIGNLEDDIRLVGLKMDTLRREALRAIDEVYELRLDKYGDEAIQDVMARFRRKVSET